MIRHIICTFLLFLPLTISSEETSMNIRVTQTNGHQILIKWDNKYNGEYKIQYQNALDSNLNKWITKTSKKNEILLTNELDCGSKYRIKISYYHRYRTYFDTTQLSVGKPLQSLSMSLTHDKSNKVLTVSWKVSPRTQYVIKSKSVNSCNYIPMGNQCFRFNEKLNNYFKGCETKSCGNFGRSLKHSVEFNDIQPNTFYIVSIFTIQNDEVKQFCETIWTVGESSPVTQVKVIPQNTSISVKWSPPSSPGGLIQIYLLELTNLSDKNCKYVTIMCRDCNKMENYVNDTKVKQFIVSKCKKRSGKNIKFSSNDINFNYAFTNLAPFTNYSINITAVNGNGPGEISTSDAQTRETEPGKCDNLVFSQIKSSSMKLDWKCDHPNGKIKTYRIRINGSSETEEVGINSYQLQNLEECTKYCVTVRVENSMGPGDWSHHICSSTAASTPPKPTRVTANGYLADTIYINWMPYTYKCGARYQVEKMLNGQQEIINTTQSNYYWTHLPQGVSFSFRVRAIAKVDSTQIGPWSDTASDTTKLQAPDTPRNIILTQPNDFTLNVKWDPPSPPNNIVESYHLYVNSSLIATDHSSTHFTLHNINPCTQYCVNITSFNLKGNGKSVMRCLKTNPTRGEKCNDIFQQFQKENMALMRRQVEALEQIAKFKDVFIQLYSSVHNLKLKGVSDNN